MATVQFIFTHPQATYNKTFTVADADLVRLIVAYRERHGLALTNVEVLTKVVDALMREMREDTLKLEKLVAARTAENAITSIAVT